jgi:large subunit ribosomal protein L3
MALKMGLLGKKLGMTQVFLSDGNRCPVTVVHAGPNVVVNVRTPDKHGYAAVQLGYDEMHPRHVNRPATGYFKKQGVKAQRMLREIRVPADVAAKFQPGQTLKLSDVFQAGVAVDVVGTSKGKGYQGVMKRHQLGGMRNTHGTHEFFRHGGSIGCRLTPGRVHKGKRMSGHMGSDRKTIQNLELVEIHDEDNVLLIRGAIPGANGDYVAVKGAMKKDKYKRRSYEIKEQQAKNPMKASKAGQKQ